MAAPITILCANLKGNLGDFAILEIMGRSFSQRFPDAKVGFYYHANKPVDETRFKRFLDELEFPMTDMGPAPFYRRPSWFRLLSKIPGTNRLSTLIHNVLIGRVADRICGTHPFVETLRDSRLVVFAGGAQWGKANLNLNMFAQLTCASRYNYRVVTFPFGISKEAFDCNGPGHLATMLSLLKQPIPVRDAISHRMLQDAGVRTSLVSDCVFMASEMFAALRSTPPARSNKVYVSVTGSGKTSAQGIIDLFARLRQTGLEPILFSSCESEDRPLVEAVLSLSDEKFIAPTSWKSTVTLFAEARFIISNRLHCLIFSALAGSAVVPVANRQKAQAYARDAGLDFTPSEISDISMENIADYVDTLDTVRTKQQRFLEASAETTANIIAQICALGDELANPA